MLRRSFSSAAFSRACHSGLKAVTSGGCGARRARSGRRLSRDRPAARRSASTTCRCCRPRRPGGGSRCATARCRGFACVALASCCCGLIAHSGSGLGPVRLKQPASGTHSANATRTRMGPHPRQPTRVGPNHHARDCCSAQARAVPAWLKTARRCGRVRRQSMIQSRAPACPRSRRARGAVPPPAARARRGSGRGRRPCRPAPAPPRRRRRPWRRPPARRL